MILKPDISIVIPIYNQSHLVANAINSIRNQTIQNFELIIVDDGSSDGDLLEEVVKKFDDKRIKLFKLPTNFGLVYARNFGNKEAQAEVIAIQDADDLSMPNRLEKCLKEIDKGFDVVVHGLYINMWDAQFKCIGRKYVPPQSSPVENIINSQNIVGVPVFRKKVWENKPFRKETEFAYDWMMHIDWLFTGQNYQFLDEGLYEYVRHENSASQRFEKEGKRKESMDKIKEIMQKEYGIQT